MQNVVIITAKMSVRALFMCRLLRLRASWTQGSIDMFPKVSRNTLQEHCFGTSCVNRAENGTKLEHLTPTIQPSLSRRRRSLSPLERVSSLLPQDSLTPEVEELRDPDQHDLEHDSSTRFDVEEETGYFEIHKDDGQMSDQASSEETQGTAENLCSGPLHQHGLKGETLLTFGEMIVADYRKDGQVAYSKMFLLQAGVRLQSSWGFIQHKDIAGKAAGSFIKTHKGASFLIRRPSLEDYVLLMRRIPAIAYPKDAAALLMMMDVSEGDCVLEAGSGSGCMSLFLSKAVGASGRVLSVDVREDHLKRAVLNYDCWRTSWKLRRGESWPDNVEFVQTNLFTSASILQGQGFHAIFLDLIHPQLALPVVIPHLHSGAVCAIYLANITQVVDLLEGMRCLNLPLLCERIMEIPIRDWIVAPAVQKDGRYCVRKSPCIQENVKNDDDGASKKDQTGTEGATEQEPAFGTVPYIARPHPEQLSHTAFLVKLRKHAQQ